MPHGLRRHLCLVAAQLAWLAGWLSRQLDNRGDAATYWTIARDLAREANETSLLACVLVATSSLHSAVTDLADCDGRIAVALLDEAEAVADTRSPAALRSWILARRAEEAAAAGDAAECARVFDAAERTISAGAGSAGGLLADWDDGRLALWRSHCVIHLAGETIDRALVEAIAVLERALSALDSARLYDRSRIMIELAEAHASLHEPEPACTLLVGTLDLAGEVGLVSHLRRVQRVRQRLDPWSGTSAVRELDERLRLAP
jgi:hypothetical protein